jgi:hypothetical protein
MPGVPSPDWLSWAVWAQNPATIRDLVITIAALVGIPFVIWREWLHHRQTRAVLQQTAIAQRRHEAQVEADRERRITDNFTRAVDQLGSDKLETRLGAIYALERIARESKADHWPIMETLTAYVRERSRWIEPSQAAEGISKQLEWLDDIQPATDVHAVLTVIGRRRREFETAGQCLNLNGADLRGYDLRGAHLERALLTGAHLGRARLCQTHLEGAVLAGARLRWAEFQLAYLNGANLLSTDLTQDQFDSAIKDANTKVPRDIRWPVVGRRSMELPPSDRTGGELVRPDEVSR